MVVGYDTFSFVLDFSSESLNERLVTFEVMQENKRRTELKYFTKFDMTGKYLKNKLRH